MNATLTRPSDREPRRTPNKNRTGLKAEHGLDNHLNDTEKEIIVTDEEIKQNKKND
jgi:hypothetical protein